MARTSKLCWRVVARADILVLFLISAGILSGFHHWEWYLLWVYHIWPFLCWGRFLLCTHSDGFLSEMGVGFVKGFFHIYWEYHLVIILQFVNVVYHTDGFVDMEEPCIPGINPTWSWCTILWMYCWMWFASILLRIFASMFISEIGL